MVINTGSCTYPHPSRRSLHLEGHWRMWDWQTSMSKLVSACRPAPFSSSMWCGMQLLRHAGQVLAGLWSTVDVRCYTCCEWHRDKIFLQTTRMTRLKEKFLNQKTLATPLEFFQPHEPFGSHYKAILPTHQPSSSFTVIAGQNHPFQHWGLKSSSEPHFLARIDAM